jgi:hypothetical protein
LDQRLTPVSPDTKEEITMSIGPLFGGGGFYNSYGPSGPYGAYPGCGCSSFFIILAGFLLIIGGCLRSFNM